MGMFPFFSDSSLGSKEQETGFERMVLFHVSWCVERTETVDYHGLFLNDLQCELALHTVLGFVLCLPQQSTTVRHFTGQSSVACQ